MRKQSFIFLLTLFSLVLFSCEDDNKDYKGEGGNEQIISHRSLLGLKGDVHQVTQRLYDELSSSDFYDESSMTFDKEGRLLSYKAELDSFSYTYESDKLVEVEALYGDGRGNVSFKFSYGGHDAYAPCPVSVGGLTQYLIKGLSKVEVLGNVADDYSFSYVCDGKILTWADNHDELSVLETYTFKGLYPEKRTKVTQIAGDEESDPIESVETTYSYDANGCLISAEEVKDMYGEKSRHLFTYLNGNLQIEEVLLIMDNNESLYIDQYSYNEDGAFIKKIRKNDEMEQVLETAGYENFDEDGNWKLKVGGLKSPWGISLTTYYVKRSIKYF